ncbi:hypothetical protein [Streptomyces sp. LHW50302]
MPATRYRSRQVDALDDIRPRLRADALFTATDHGVLLQYPEGRFVLKGRGGLGAWRSTSTTPEPRHGDLHRRYTLRTLGIWLASLAAGGAPNPHRPLLGMHEDTRPVMLSIGLGTLGETVTLGARALATGLPFAPSADGRGHSSQPVGPTPDAASRRAREQPSEDSPTLTEAVRRLRGDAAGGHRWRD